MLVIRRRAGETVVIGNDVEIEVLEICGSHVKMGIRAPSQVLILRKEVQLTGAENRIASQLPRPLHLEALRDGLRNASGLRLSNESR